MAEENPLAGYSDDGLVAEAWQHQARQDVFGIEMSRRLKIAIAEQSRAAEKLGNKIWWLNFWLLVATVAWAGSDHEMLAAEQELKIARDHLQAAGTDYGGHRRAAMEHLDEALREIREGVKFSRSGAAPTPRAEHPGKAPRPERGPEADED